MRSFAEIITIMPVVASRMSTGNSKRAIPSRSLYAIARMIETAEPISTSTFMKRPKPSTTKRPLNPTRRSPPPEMARQITTMSTRTASHETKRAECSPRKTPIRSSAIAAHTVTISGSAGSKSGTG